MSGEKTSFLTSKQRRKIRNNLTGYAFIIPNLVGYTVCQYFLDQYMISSLKDHRGKHVKVDLIATFLPSEVVESLYTTMNKIGLEVASITGAHRRY